jgi:hypothetical protein
MAARKPAREMAGVREFPAPAILTLEQGVQNWVKLRSLALLDVRSREGSTGFQIAQLALDVGLET